MAQFKRSNPLALAVLACVGERPMHPYEMAATMKQRGKHENIKLNYGSLYTVVDSLQKNGLIEPVETIREGRRPERTVYAITETGRLEFTDWLSDLLRLPVKEYTQFEAGLSLLPGVSPEEAVRLLRARCLRLQSNLRHIDAMFAVVRERNVPRIFVVEGEYVRSQLVAELAWVTALVQEVEDGTLEGMDVWRHYHERVVSCDGPNQGKEGEVAADLHAQT
jgi:DNA-binding PadR family transcriptional regulator